MINLYRLKNTPAKQKGEFYMKKRLLCALFAAAFVVSGAMAGCSGGDASKTDSSAVESKADESSKAAESKADDAPKADDAQGGEFKGLTATKIGRAKISTDKAEFTAGGIIYRSGDGKYGVLSLDGKNDTGAKFATAQQASGDYRAEKYVDVATLASDNDKLNTHGLISKNAEEAIPTKYGCIKVLNDRYAFVATFDGETTDTTKIVATIKTYDDSGNSSEKSYSGKWEVFDLKAKATVKNVGGKVYDEYKTYLSAAGKFISYKNEDGRRITIDDTGAEITDGRKILSNGDYVLEINGKSAVYNSEDAKVFSFDSSSFNIDDFDNCYYIGKDSDYKKFLVNSSGEVITEKTDDYFSNVYPDFYRLGKKVYKIDGTAVNISFDVSSLKMDEVNKDTYIASNNEKAVIFDKQGNIIFEQPEGKEYYTSGFCPQKKDESYNYFYYDFSKKTYSIQGNSLYDVDWIVKVEEGSVYKVVDLRTGQALTDNYGSFGAVTDSHDGISYIYAFNSVNGQTSKGDFDVYTVSVGK